VLGAGVDQLVLFEQVEAPVVADRVGDPGAGQVAEHPRGDDARKRQFALGDAEAGKEHDCLAGDRDAGRLQRHQQEDGNNSGGADEFGGDVDNRFHDLVREAREEDEMHRRHSLVRSLRAGERDLS
jgi:hypothetical protein